MHSQYSNVAVLDSFGSKRIDANIGSSNLALALEFAICLDANACIQLRLLELAVLAKLFQILHKVCHDVVVY